MEEGSHRRILVKNVLESPYCFLINKGYEPVPPTMTNPFIKKRRHPNYTMANRILPLELIDKAIGSQIWILMRGKTEIVGTLRGFDDYVSLLAAFA